MLLPSELPSHVPVLPKAELALEIAPALLGVGYILGYRQSAIMVSGSLISALVLTPLIALVGDGLRRAAVPRDDAHHPRDERRPDLVALRALHRRGRGGRGGHRHRGARAAHDVRVAARGAGAACAASDVPGGGEGRRRAPTATSRAGSSLAGAGRWW